jgi:hypothetical protein
MKVTDHIVTRGTQKVHDHNFEKFDDSVHTNTKRLTPIQQESLHPYPSKMKADPKHFLGLADRYSVNLVIQKKVTCHWSTGD